MIKFLFRTVLPLGASKVNQTHIYDDFLNHLIQLFPMTPYSILVQIKVVRNYVQNNFKHHDYSLGYTVFTPRDSEVGKI